MSASVLHTDARVVWGGTRDEEGHRTFKIVHQVKCTSENDGPYTVMNATGLPTIGSAWTFGNDFDLWAFCTPEMKVRRHPDYKRGEPAVWWYVEQTFSTVPQERCADTQIENPLDEPDKISGSFSKFTREAQQDRNGDLILSSSHEPITGVERDDNRPTVVVEQNISDLGLDTFSAMVDTVNDAGLWGLPARTIKLSNVSWERHIYGTCFFYYTRRLEFEVDFDTFDRDDIADRGFKEFNPNIADNPINRANPANYVHIKDPNDENVSTPQMLDGNGSLNNDPVNNPKFLAPAVELYNESNFLTLGIPTSL